jgi:hypothetical protein
MGMDGTTQNIQRFCVQTLNSPSLIFAQSQRKVRHMAGEGDAGAYKEVTVDPNSQLVELVPGCNDDAVDIIVPAGGGEEHVQADTASEDDISVPGENKHRKRSRSKAKKRDHIVSEAKAPKLRPAGGMNSVWEQVIWIVLITPR